MSTKQNTAEMVTIKVASKELGILKVKIKNMIRDKNISFKQINGNYYVDKNEILNYINSKSTPYILKVDKEINYILKETLEDFKYTIGVEHYVVPTIKRVLKNGCIKNNNELITLLEYFSINVDKVIDTYPNDVIEWIDIKSEEEFKRFRKHYVDLFIHYKSVNNYQKYNDYINLSICIEHYRVFEWLHTSNIKLYSLTTYKLQQFKDFCWNNVS